jgi:hypothetical protein
MRLRGSKLIHLSRATCWDPRTNPRRNKRWSHTSSVCRCFSSVFFWEMLWTGRPVAAHTSDGFVGPAANKNILMSTASFPSHPPIFLLILSMPSRAEQRCATALQDSKSSTLLGLLQRRWAIDLHPRFRHRRVILLHLCFRLSLPPHGEAPGRRALHG